MQLHLQGWKFIPTWVGPQAPCTSFADVPVDYWSAAWIKQLAAEGITGGCGNGNYCPEQAVTRAQMAVFLTRTLACLSPNGTNGRHPASGRNHGAKMKRTFLLILMIALLAACTPATAYPNEGYPPANQPVTSGETPMPSEDSFLPQPSDSDLTRGEVLLDSSSLSTLESYPLQFMLTVKGNLPTPCHQLRVAVGQPDADRKINVDVYSVAKPDEICAQMVEPFEVHVPLGSFPTGHYFLFVNGTQVAKFES